MTSREDEPDTLVKGVLERPSTEGERDEMFAREQTRVSSFYALGEVIGRGGMGEVLLAHDRRIGRDVAVKRLRDTNPSEDEVARFLREARIQARLEHPAIVPVYEVGRDESGRPYFTMKRLTGVTLTDLLESPTPAGQRLLRAFADVCRAIDFAHTRGIVHRDLKPGNIRIGDFGDVYVLDWGVARVVDDAPADVITADIDTLEGTAPEGRVLGTPGYMAPEQLQHPEVGRPSDVYALGAILFELLAGEPLHPRGAAAIQSTLADVAIGPAKRRPERTIAPELDALCIQMLAKDPALRPTARRVADRVEEYLDGDRDVARRRTMAVDLVWTARAAFDECRRADAMRSAGRALALDPENAGAAELVTTLMLQPPAEPPLELQLALHEADAQHVRRRARTAMLAYSGLVMFLPIAAWNGVRHWPLVLGVAGFAIVNLLAALLMLKRPNRTLAELMIYSLLNAGLLVMISRMAGPFTFVPALACFMVMSTMSYPPFAIRSWPLVLVIVVGFLAPIVLEHYQVLAKTWEIREGELVSRAGALELHGSTSVTMVIVASVVTIIIAGIHSATTVKSNRQAQQLLVTQAWHLRQLLPAASTNTPTPFPATA